MRADRLRAVRLRGDERGETLIEVLVALSLLAVAVAVIIGGIATSIRVTDIHRKQATAGAYARDFAESVETSVAASPTGYVSCATATTYQSLYTLPVSATLYRREVAAVAYWNGTAFTTTCGTDQGVQRLTLRVYTTDSRASETLDLVVRRPCRPGDTGC